MKIFITGATGVLGRRLVKELVSRGHSVTGMARSPRGEDTVRFLGGVPSGADLFNSESLLPDIEGSDVIVHAATSIPVKMRLKPEDFTHNDRIRREGTRILTDCAGKTGVKKLIFQSVTWVSRPEDGLFFDESSRPNPDRTTASAVEGERITEEAADKYGFIPTVLRCGFFYGADASHTRVMADGIRRRRFPIIGSGENIWSNIHVDDAALAFVTAAIEDLKGVWHVVDDHPVSVGEYFSLFAQKLGAPAPPHLSPWIARLLAGGYTVGLLTKSTFTSNRKLKNASGWAPRYPSCNEGLDQIMQEWKSEGFF